jgi:hypothetical protein
MNEGEEMPVEIVRGQVGTENVWNIGQEGGFIAYMRGSIGDLPVRSEEIALADVKLFDDSYGLSEEALQSEGEVGEDAASYEESTVIMNS